MSQNYDTINLAELAEECSRLDTSTTSFLDSFVKMPERDGFVVVRLLPPTKGGKFYVATRTHRVNGHSLHCPRELVGRTATRKAWLDEDATQPCPICMYYSNLWKQADGKEGHAAEELQNQARSIKPVERYYYNCIVRSQLNPKTNETEKNVGPKILSVGKMIHQKIVKAIVGDVNNDERPLGDVTHFKEGRDFKIIRKMRGAGPAAYPNYDETKFLDPSPLGDPDQCKTWLGNLHDLAALRRVQPYEEIKLELKRHLGLVEEQTDTGFDPSEFQRPQIETDLALLG